MKYKEVTKHVLNPLDYKKRYASDSDVSIIYNEPITLTENGVPRIVYTMLDDDCASIIDALETIEYKPFQRTMGLSSVSQTFGYSPRNALRRNFCRSAVIAEKYPDAHAIVCDYARVVTKQYISANSTIFRQHQALTDRLIHPAYTLPDSAFTSGIINYNSAMAYHFDTGNFPDVWSCMLVFRKDTTGGHLVVPEYDCGFALPNNSLLMFDGQSLLHGVTPIIKHSIGAFRYSVVYYSLHSMWDCVSPEDELQRIRTVKTAIERKRH